MATEIFKLAIEKAEEHDAVATQLRQPKIQKKQTLVFALLITERPLILLFISSF